MKRKKLSPYMALFLAVFCCLNFPDRWSNNLRLLAVSSLAPSWSLCQKLQRHCIKLASSTSSFYSEPYLQKIDALTRENYALQQQMETIRAWILHDDRIEEHVSRIKAILPEEKEEKWRQYFQKRRKELSSLLQLELKAIPAKVIYRDPSSWSSFVWLDIGEKHNRALQDRVIAKNSPVVMGKTLVGVVEEVGEKQCKVRLITDANLCPSVRSMRGGRQNELLSEQIEGLMQLLRARQDLFSSKEQEMSLLLALQKILAKIDGEHPISYWAKGELQGSSRPLWRSRGRQLKGLGFNYEFADEEGPARDLRTGVSKTGEKEPGTALLKEGDLLVTSGLDGIFPEGLEVAFISKVHRLKEGASSYEIEAQGIIENLHGLEFVFVLPPVPSF